MVDIPEGNDFIDIAAGLDSLLALREDGRILSWGLDYNNGRVVNRNVENFPDEAVYTSISSHLNHSLALRINGTIAAWGNDQLGSVNNTPSEESNRSGLLCTLGKVVCKYRIGCRFLIC